MKMMPWKKRPGEAVRGGDGAQALGRFRSEMDRLFQRWFDEPWGAFGPFGAEEARGPALDVLDGEKEVTVRVELPGLGPKDFELSLSGRTLTISGEKKGESEERRKGFTRSECWYGSFRRSVELPAGVDAEKVSADYANGILTVRVGKSKAAEARRIAISKK
jgi:HSP20 family protein